MRDVEVFESIKEDNLSYLLTTRHEKRLRNIDLCDTPEMLLGECYPIQVASYFGATKCFFYLIEKSQRRGDLKLLHFASAGGNLEIVRYLLTGIYSGAINVTDKYGNTALHYAAKFGRVEIFKFLVMNGSDLLIKNVQGFCPGHFAACNGCVEIIEILVKEEGTSHSRNSSLRMFSNLNWLPLHYAIKYGHEYIAEILIKNRFYSTVDNTFISLIQLASLKRMYKIVNLLLDKKVPYSDQNHNGWNAALFAASVGSVTILQNLFSKFGKDMFSDVDRLYRNIAHVAAINNYPDVLGFVENFLPELLHEKDRMGLTPFMYACKYGHEAVVKALVSKVDLNDRDRAGNTALHIAITSNVKSVINRLLLHNADLEARNNFGMTPLFYSVIYSSKDILEFLLEKGCDKNVTAEEYQINILMKAILVEDIEKVDYLLSIVDLLKADNRGWGIGHYLAIKPIILNRIVQNIDQDICSQIFKQKDNNGQTPFLLACKFDIPASVSTLVNFVDVDINESDNDNNTPLHHACRRDNVRIVKELMKCNDKLHVNLRNSQYKTALHVCVESWAIASFMVLIRKHLIRLNTPDLNDMSPIMLACKLGVVDIVRYLVDLDTVRLDMVSKDGANCANYASVLPNKTILCILAESKRAASINFENVWHDISPKAVLREIELYRNRHKYGRSPADSYYDEEDAASGNGSDELFLEMERKIHRENISRNDEIDRILLNGEVYLRRTSEHFDVYPGAGQDDSSKIEQNLEMITHMDCIDLQERSSGEIKNSDGTQGSGGEEMCIDRNTDLVGEAHIINDIPNHEQEIKVTNDTLNHEGETNEVS